MAQSKSGLSLDLFMNDKYSRFFVEIDVSFFPE